MDETNPVRNALYQFKLKQDRLSKDLDELERRRANDPKLLDISLNAIVETARITTDFIRRQEREKGRMRSALSWELLQRKEINTKNGTTESILIQEGKFSISQAMTISAFLT